MRNILETVQAAASRTPETQALVCGDVRMTYRELLRCSHAFGRALTALGVPAGSRVAIFLDKRFETVVSMLGAAAAGCVFVPVNPLLKPHQVSHVLRDCSAQCLVTTALRARILDADGSAALPHVIVVDEPGEPGMHAGAAINTRRWPGAASPDAIDHDDACTSYPAIPGIDTDLAAILYTSGSTGLPKGVMLSHRNLLEGAWSVATYLRHDPCDRILAVLPLSFDAGLSQLTSA
jgi:acyl-CoA synthetase (AMP-forming)/AMP-acid ligase II